MSPEQRAQNTDSDAGYAPCRMGDACLRKTGNGITGSSMQLDIIKEGRLNKSDPSHNSSQERHVRRRGRI
jgi:hypothetical protein